MGKYQIDGVSPESARLDSRSMSARLLHWAGIVLVITVWISATLFGLYILAFYVGAMADGEMTQWNNVLPSLYEPDTPLATIAIGLHFVAGGVILALGCIQLIDAVRLRYPALHSLLGRVYVSAAILAGVGGLTFIVAKGTIGGAVMDIGFSLYGVLMVVAAVQTVRHAQMRRPKVHRAWALRLFSLAIGSWLYRMYYGFWLLMADGVGHTQDFRGPFDLLMAFFFYMPNLLLVEVFIREPHPRAPSGLKLIVAGVLVGVTGFLLLGTYFFTRIHWGPAIMHRLVG